jgi:hypothetical protein
LNTCKKRKLGICAINKVLGALLENLSNLSHFETDLISSFAFGGTLQSLNFPPGVSSTPYKSVKYLQIATFEFVNFQPHEEQG